MGDLGERVAADGAARVDGRTPGAGTTARVDERTLGAGTTVRFALLVALLVASSSLILLYVAIALSAYDGFSCNLAAGVDPVTDPAANVMARRALQWEAYRSCSERYAPPPSGWWLLGWWALLALCTAALFRVLPAWKARRSRVVPLAAVDPDGEIGRTLADLCAVAGLARPPRAVVDLAADSAGAVVFGRTGRATVCLHIGLVTERATDPARFRAVLLHELAHIANRDVTVTYLTVALWRVHVAVAVPLFLLWCGWKFRTASESQVWSAEAPVVARGLLVTGLLAVLVYLARSDVLRSREVYADLAAVRWGADPAAGWSTAPAPAGGRGRRIRHAFAQLWHPHPGWEVRRAALTDPAVLFGVRALPLVLTGAAAAITHTHIAYAITQYNLLTTWTQHAAALVPAALVAGVVGTALWRAAVYAALTGQPAPSSVRAGLWLGLGLAGGSAVAGQGTINEWLPARPWLFALVVAAAVAFTWWLTQCARLWVVAWRGRSLRGVALLNLTAAALALSLWFFWWQSVGAAYAAGWSFDVAGLRDYLMTQYTGGTELDHPPVSPVDRAYVLLMTVGPTSPPLALLALAGLWAVPLLAWLPRPGVGPPRWVRDAAPGDGPAPGPPPPRLRRVLVAGLLGGVAGSLAAVAHSAWLHGRERPSATAFLVTFVAGTILALVIAAAVAGAAARVAVPAHRLPAALIAGAVATFLGSATVVALRVLDGCVPALALDAGSCSWELAGPLRMFPSVIVPALPVTVLVAGAAVALPRPRGAPPPGRPRSMAWGRSCALLLVTAGLAVATVHAAQRMPHAGRLPAEEETQRIARQGGYALVAAPVSARSRALQAQAWLDVGGDDLLDRFWRGRRDLFAAVTTGVQAGRSIDRLDDVRPLCAEISEFARAAVRFFRVPDPETHPVWQRFVALARQGSQECQQALDADQAEQFNTAMRKLATAQETGHAVDDRLDALLRRGGL
ncbi:M56 family metallopeptidase [Micromonospora okii]|uniref:M56 family metallopeptidase n=1 Tax=Micromonospora okii TaxID=1182970 RepID=UPI001E645790|nr:M56 family metallopeptidase [Micromonospora okii]